MIHMQMVQFYRCFMFKTDLLFNQSSCVCVCFFLYFVGVVCFSLFLTRLKFAKKQQFCYRNNSEKITPNRILRIDSTQIQSDKALKLNNKTLKK